MLNIRRFAAVLAAVPVLLALVACDRGGGDELVVYSGRNENLVRPLLERFARDTGIDIRVRYASTSELLPTIVEEGSGTRADVFFSQDAGALAELAERGLLAALPDSIVELVDERFRDPDGRWIGVTGRARVIAYNTDRVPRPDVPDSTLAVADEEWKGRVGIAPTNASFIGYVSALVDQIGEDRTRGWLEALRANDARTYDNNVAILDAVASGEIDLGLVNHYYLYNEFKERPDAPVANHFPGQGDGGEGTFVNVAGVGILAGTDQSEAAQRFVQYLLGEEAQAYFRDDTAEYPLRSGLAPIDELPPLADLKTIDIPLHELGADLEATLDLLEDVGLT